VALVPEESEGTVILALLKAVWLPSTRPWTVIVK